MFHVLLVLPALIMIAVLISAFLFGVSLIIISIVAGASTAAFVKTKLFRRLLFISFCIISLIGVLCTLPIVVSYLQLSELFFSLAILIICFCLGTLAVVGIVSSASIRNRVGRISIVTVFSLVLIASIAFPLLLAVLRNSIIT